MKSVTVHQLILHASMIMQDGARYLKFPSKAPTIGDIHKKMNRIKITSEIFFEKAPGIIYFFETCDSELGFENIR